MIVVDASFAYAVLDRRDAGHAAATAWYIRPHDELVTTPLALVEVDHLAATRLGQPGRAAFRSDVAAGGYHVAWWDSATRETIRIADRYADLGVSLTDASLVALAARLGTNLVATFDERHFRAMTPVVGAPAFKLLPADA